MSRLPTSRTRSRSPVLISPRCHFPALVSHRAHAAVRRISESFWMVSTFPRRVSMSLSKRPLTCVS